MSSSAAPSAPLMLSVSGLRGIVGASLTPEVAARYGSALGAWFVRHRGASPRVVVGRDSRPSGEMVENAVVAGLSAAGCRVVRLGILSTPGVAWMVRRLGADGGVVLTASHNPTPWNGVKCLRHDGVAPPKAEAEEIVALFRGGAIPLAGATGIPPAAAAGDAVRAHVARILELVDAAAIRAANLHAVVDATCGAGGPEAEALLAALGVRCTGLWLEPSGAFPHNPEPTRENLSELAAQVPRAGAACGFALDPDADRLAIVDEQGRYIGEEYTLALAVLHKLPAGGATAANLSTSRMLDDIAAARGGRVVRSAVGEANVAEAMRAHGCTVGGEGNGGVIFPAISQVRDSFLAMAFTLELLAARRRPLSAIVAEIPSYAMVKEKQPVDPALVARLAQVLPAAFPEARADTRDGVRLDWPDRWVHVRASNTEPIVRLISEAPDAAGAARLVEDCRRALGA